MFLFLKENRIFLYALLLILFPAQFELKNLAPNLAKSRPPEIKSEFVR